MPSNFEGGLVIVLHHFSCEMTEKTGAENLRFTKIFWRPIPWYGHRR